MYTSNIIQQNFVKLISAVKVPSLFSLKEYSKISDILDINTFENDAYSYILLNLIIILDLK